MIAIAVSASFLAGLGVEFDVEDLQQGLHWGWLDESDVVAVALNEVVLGTDDPTLIEIGCLLSDELDRVQDLLFEQESAAVARDEPCVPSRTWRYALLKAAFDRRAELSDPLGLVEEIYADFGYPAEMGSFVRYMPLHPGDPPGESALVQRWERFLVSERAKLARVVNHR